MRIIAGKHRSRKLTARVPEGTRPTSDRLRETLFNILGPRVIESVFLDAYAGTGAVGIEALSRGAKFVWFVEHARGAVAAIRSNLASLGIAEGCRVLDMELENALARCRAESVRFDLVFLDPPYQADDLYRRDLDLLGAGSLIAPRAWVVVEHPRRMDLPAAAGTLRRTRSRNQGTTTLTFYEAEGS